MIPSTSGPAAEASDPGSASDSAVEPAATPIPTARAGDFPDVIVYEGRKDNRADGKKQIYLLNLGSAPVDLFDGSSNDSDPVWSPDGEWIAFLSDRTGKAEVFVINLANNKVVQLSNNPGVTWEGPLSWSADGQRIALTGVRDQEGGQRWVYVVAVDGAGAHPLAGTRGGSTPEFAPNGDRLAYIFSDGSQSGITVYHLETGEKVTTSWPENAAAWTPAPGSALDWSVDGSGLVYITTDPAGDIPQASSAAAQSAAAASGDPVGDAGSAPRSQIMAARDLNESISLTFDLSRNFQIAQSTWPGAFRAVSWTPGGIVIYLEDLSDARANDKPGTTTGGCLTIQARSFGLRAFFSNNSGNSPNSSVSSGRFWSVNGVCVEGGLDHESWTPDGRWVVVLGRSPSSQQRSLYAVRMPGRGPGYYYSRPRQNGATPLPSVQGTPLPTFQDRPEPAPTTDQLPVGSTLRLIDANWVGALPRVRPQLSPSRQPININPQPVAETKPLPPPSDLSQRPDGPTGQIVYTVQNSSVSAVVKANPDGTGGKVLATTTGINRCPRFSPDGQSIALIAPGGTYSQGVGANPQPPGLADPYEKAPSDEVYVMNASGENVIQISSSSDFLGMPLDALTYGCPIWSPTNRSGGPYVAVLATMMRHWYLVILPAYAVSQENSAPLHDSAPLRRIISLGTPLQGLGPVWSPDGSSLYLVQRPPGGDAPQLMQITVPRNPLDPISSSVVNIREDWTRVLAMTIDPTGNALIALEQAGSDHAGTSKLVVFRRISFTDPGGGNFAGSPLALDEQSQLDKPISASITLLYGSRSTVGLLLEGNSISGPQAEFIRYDLSYGISKVLAQVEDTVTDLAWSPDGRWVVYSSESGLWGLDMVEALSGRASPVWLSPVPVQGLDWR